MTGNRIRAVFIGRPLFFLFCILFPGSGVASAQRYVSASVESKSLSAGRKSVMNKDICCSPDGSLTVHSQAQGTDLWYFTSRLGSTRIYSPQTNEVINDVQGIMDAKDELLYLFANGMGEDLGISKFDFVISDSKKEDGYVKRTFTAKQSSSKCAKAEIIYKNFLPICAIYYDKKGNVLTKTYLSDYAMMGSLAFPKRVTEITYFMEKNDSTVRLDIYSDIKVGAQDPKFRIEVPSDAKTVDLKEFQKQLKKASK